MKTKKRSPEKAETEDQVITKLEEALGTVLAFYMPAPDANANQNMAAFLEFLKAFQARLTFEICLEPRKLKLICSMRRAPGEEDGLLFEVEREDKITWLQ